MTPPTATTDVPLSAAGNPIGFGRMLRKEDARFLRGKGQYLDDITLPGMLHGALLRSPHAHANILSIDTSAAEAHPKVKAVITGAILETLNLAWMPTMSGDTQAVLATDRVRFQGQEVAFVVAEDRYAARDALELIEVDYEVLPPVVDALTAMDAGTPVIRTDQDGRTDNLIFDWESGDAAACEAVIAKADVVVSADILYPRSHPSPMETCGSIADMNKVTGKLTCWITSQAPHAHRTVYALVAGLPEQKIQVISPDIGGGFGNKVPVYPGYVCVVVASIVTGVPVKWMEDRSENLMTTGFARDYHMHGEIAATKDGKILALRTNTLADHGAFNATAQPTKYPAGFFHIFTGSYDIEAAHCKVRGVYTNKAPGGVAYACSFRITEAVYFVERMVDILAHDLGMDPAELRMKNLIQPDQFPYTTKTGWEYDSGNYPLALQTTLDIAGYDARVPNSWPTAHSGRPPVRARSWVSGCRSSPKGWAPDPASTWTSSASAWPTGASSASTRPARVCSGCRCSPRARATRPRSPRSCRTSWASHLKTSRSSMATPIRHRSDSAPTDHVPRPCRARPPRWWPAGCASGPGSSPPPRLNRAAEDLEWEPGRWQVKGDPSKAKTIQEIAMLAHSSLELPEGVEGQLDATAVYNPPNLTYPYGAYLCVVDVDPGTGVVKVRRFIATDDCGPRINPMIVEGQIHGGLAEGIGMALMQVIAFDEDGNCLGGSFMDYLLPTPLECPSWEMGETVTPSPHHPLGCKGVGESATVGSPPAVVNAVMDALSPFGVRHADMPLTPAQVWLTIQGRPARTDLALT